MALIVPQHQDGYIFFDANECVAAGEALAERYRNAEPFPHIVIDEFLPADFLRDLLSEFPDSKGKDYFNREQESLKFQYTPSEVPGRRLRNVLVELNSPAILKFLESLTGIKGLLADAYYSGGGLHETKSGGHLGIHADFNILGRMNIQRRINLLLYLNDDWSQEWGGELELWDRQMQTRCHSISPTIGRAVIFNTDLDSFHGQPGPVRCPPDRSRRSIAIYYYSAPPEGIRSLPRRTTAFKVRPGSADRADRDTQLRHFINDWMPPRLRQFASRLGRPK